LASLGLWLTLDAGNFQTVRFNTSTNDVELTLEGNSDYTPDARLRIQQPADLDVVGMFSPDSEFTQERDAFVIPLDEGKARVSLVD
jgi:hypothetical protein